MEKIKTVKAGSRESKLAVVQSMIIIDMLKNKNPGLDIELVTMKTTGDKILDRTLDKIGGKGLFVKELDRALREKEVDITIHSLKDLPVEGEADIPIIGYSKRESPFDVIVLPKNSSEIDFKKPIGCSSKRRIIQFKRLYPHAQFKPVRGNVLTRLEKLDRGEFSALILAQAGLERLGMSDRIFKIFSPDEVIPAAGQGIIAVQGRAGEDYSYVEEISDKNARLCAEIERAFVAELSGGCSDPIAGYCEIINGNEFILRGLYSKDEKTVCDVITGEIHKGVDLAVRLAQRLK